MIGMMRVRSVVHCKMHSVWSEDYECGFYKENIFIAPTHVHAARDTCGRFIFISGGWSCG